MKSLVARFVALLALGAAVRAPSAQATPHKRDRFHPDIVVGWCPGGVLSSLTARDGETGSTSQMAPSDTRFCCRTSVYIE